METDTCSSCRFWVPNDEPQGITSVHGWGECRRYPPQVVAQRPGSHGGNSVFPITTGEQGCGEHKHKPEPDPRPDDPTRPVWVAPSHTIT